MIQDSAWPEIAHLQSVPIRDTRPLYVYFDETVFEDAAWGAGMLICDQPILQSIIDLALSDLEADPDRFHDKQKTQDDRTLARRYFHAADDSKNGHSHLCTSIRNAVSGHYGYSYEAPLLSKSEEEAFRRQAFLSAAVLLKLTNPITFTFEARHAFGIQQAQKLVEELYVDADHGASVVPMLPTLYPRCTVEMGDKGTAGLQVTDFVVWAMNPEVHKPGDEKTVWRNRLGLEQFYKAKTQSGRELSGEFELGAGSSIYDLASRSFTDLYPVVSPETFTLDDEGWQSMVIFTENLIHALAGSTLPNHVSHFQPLISTTSRRLQRPTDLEQVEQMARIFLRLFDTLPLYHGLKKHDMRFINLLTAKKFFALALRRDLGHGVRVLHHIARTRQHLYSHKDSD